MLSVCRGILSLCHVVGGEKWPSTLHDCVCGVTVITFCCHRGSRLSTVSLVGSSENQMTPADWSDSVNVRSMLPEVARDPVEDPQTESWSRDIKFDINLRSCRAVPLFILFLYTPSLSCSLTSLYSLRLHHSLSFSFSFLLFLYPPALLVLPLTLSIFIFNPPPPPSVSRSSSFYLHLSIVLLFLLL